MRGNNHVQTPIVQCAQFHHLFFVITFNVFTTKKFFIEFFPSVYYIGIVKVSFYDKNRFCK